MAKDKQVTFPRPTQGRRHPVAAMALAAACLLAGCSAFDDTPEPPPYPQIAKSESSQAKLLWKNTSGSDALPGFQPVVTSNGVWVTDVKGRVRRLSLKDGREEKSFRIDTKVMIGLAADDSQIILAKRSGSVIALDHDGKQLWERPLDAEIATAPQLADDAVLVRTIDGKVLALDHESGSIRWSWKAPDALLNLWQSSPILTDIDSIYVGLPQARIVSLDLRYGVPRWETTISSSLGATELERLIDIVGSPVMMGDQVCAVAYQGRVACLGASDGEVRWSRALSSSSGLAADSEDLVLVDSSEVIQMLRPGGGTVWRQDAYVRRGLTAPVIIPGKRLLFGDRFGHLSVLSMSDGSTLARIEIDDTAPASTPLVVDDTAYVQTLDGTIAAIELR